MLTATVKAQVWGRANHWSFGPFDPGGTEVFERVVRVELQGSAEEGFLLIWSPEGFFTADTWYQTRAEALEDALDTLGIGPEDWIETDA